MNRRHFLKKASAFGCTLAVSSFLYAHNQQKEKYNVIFIMADDLGPDELSCYGSKEINTPNIDKLANNGTYFNTAYTCPVCAPSRVLVMTGRYGQLTKHYNMGSRPGGPKNFEPHLDFTATEPTFAKILKNNGYKTAIAGKWQLVPPTFKKIYDAGFDEYCVWRIGHQEGYGRREKHPEGRTSKAGSRYYHPSIEKNGELQKTKPSDFGPDMYTDFLIDFMKRNREAPFLLYYPACLPHRPTGPTPDDPDQPIENTFKALKCNIEYLDKLVGRITKAVDKLGLREKTVIFFGGDNGTEKRGKNTPTERGARVPLITNCPGLIKDQGALDTLTDFSDLTPTFTDLANAKLPSKYEFSGKSLMPVLTGKTKHHRDWIFSYMGQFRILRTDNYLLELECPDYKGDFYYTNGYHDFEKYENVTDSDNPEHVKARKKFDKILKKLPCPDLTVDQRIWFIKYLENYNPEFEGYKKVYPDKLKKNPQLKGSKTKES